MIKIFTIKGSDKILGGTVIGGPAGELIMILANAIQNNIGLSKIGECTYAYPSWAEGIKHLSD